MSIKPCKPRFEHYAQDLIGVGHTRPRISWKYDGDAVSWFQEAYDLQVNWSDGTTEEHSETSSKNSLVSWPWRSLKSSEQVQVRVRVKGSGDESFTAWSDYSSVETGLLLAEDWHCQLIEPERPAPGPRETHVPVVFTRKWQLNTPVKTARLYITAHGVYEACLNGRVVGDHVLAPGWTSYSHRLTYQTFDITSHFKDSQECSLDVTVAEGWYCGRLGFLGGRTNIYGSSIGLIAQIYLSFNDGSSQVIGTDEIWTWARSPITISGLYDGETYDGSFHDSVQHHVRCGSLPAGICAPCAPPVRRISELPVKDIIHTPSGKTVIDFGQNFTGRVRLRASGPVGTTITLRHVEVLEDEEIAAYPLRGAKAIDTLILGRDEIEWEPKFTFHGFRYVEVDGWHGELVPSNFTGAVLHTDMERTGLFECSNPLLNRLHENIVWSMKSNFLSIPTDCPQRDERLGWTGDIAVFSDTANFLYETSGMLSSWLEDLAAEQLGNKGIVPLVVPNIIDDLEKDAHAVWGDAAVVVPWSVYTASGDEGVLLRQYESMKAWLEAIPRRSNGLWNYIAEWKLGDWLDPSAPPEDPGNATTDPDFVSNAFLIHITELMRDACAVLGKSEEQSSYSLTVVKLREAFTNEYITPAGRLSPDTQTAYALALSFSLISKETHRKRAAERLEELIRRNSHFGIATGFAGTPYVGHALSKAGLTGLFYRMLLHTQCPSWLYPITMGATTIWERWDSIIPSGRINPGEMTSFNHYALGAVGDWMHKFILGLRPLTPGWRDIGVQPVPGGRLSWARGEYRTPAGVVRIAWRITQDDSADAEVFHLHVVVPPNTTAHVVLPGSDVTEKLGSGKHDWQVPYVREPWPPTSFYPPHVKLSDDLPEDEELPWPGHGFSDI